MTDNWKDIINQAFVGADGQRRPATVSINLVFENGSVALPSLEVRHTDTLQAILQRAANLTSSPTTGSPHRQNAVDNPIPEQVSQRRRAVNIEHLTHGKTKYLVYRMDDDSFVVRKEDGGAEMKPGTVIYNTLVKMYREQFKLD